MLGQSVRTFDTPGPSFLPNYIRSFFYLQSITIIVGQPANLQHCGYGNRYGISCNMNGISRQIGWFYRQLPCNPANLVLFFPVNSHLQHKFPDGI